MKGSLTFIDLLNIFALFLSLFYAFQNWTLKSKSKANFVFTIYLLDIAFFILFFLLLKFKAISFLKYLVPLLVTSLLLMPPLLLKYQKKLVGIHSNDHKHFLIPIIFGVLTLILMLSVLVAKGTPYQKLVFDILQYSVIIEITAIFIISNIYYIFLSIRMIKRHKKLINSYYSYSEKIDLKWIYYLIFGYIFLIIGLIVSNLKFAKGDVSDAIFYGVLIIYVMFTGHNALRQKEVKIDQRLKGEKLSEDEETLDEQFTEAQHQLFAELKERLTEYVPQHKPYLDQELTIFKLAKDLNTNTKYLSYVINKEFNQNFINYINDYRIEEVKKHLMDEANRNLTIEALAQNAGFKSKSSFNAAFKKVTGTTPSVFIKSI